MHAQGTETGQVKVGYPSSQLILQLRRAEEAEDQGVSKGTKGKVGWGKVTGGGETGKGQAPSRG